MVKIPVFRIVNAPLIQHPYGRIGNFFRFHRPTLYVFYIVVHSQHNANRDQLIHVRAPAMSYYF
jgi:hypothetical protein